MRSRPLPFLNATVLPITLAGLIPLLPASTASWHDIARLVQIWSYVWLVVTGARALEGWQVSAIGKIWLSLNAALAIASCLHAPRPLMALREILLLGGLVLLAANVATQAPVHREVVAKIVAATAAGYVALVFCVVTIALLNRVPLDNARLLFGYDNPRFLNHVQVLCIPMLAGDIHRFTGPDTPTGAITWSMARMKRSREL